MNSASPTPLTRPGWPRAGASAAIIDGDRVLLVERGKGAPRGNWNLPGGHIEPGETAAAAAAREVFEETGVGVEIVGLLDVQDLLIRDRNGVLTAHYVLAVYWGRPAMSGTLATAGSDAADAAFVRPDRFSALNLPARTIRVIDRAFAAAASGC